MTHCCHQKKGKPSLSRRAFMMTTGAILSAGAVRTSSPSVEAAANSEGARKNESVGQEGKKDDPDPPLILRCVGQNLVLLSHFLIHSTGQVILLHAH